MIFNSQQKKMKKRIMHITVRADYGGAPNYMDLMINNISNNFEVHIACPEDKPYYQKWKDNIRVNGILLLPHRKFSPRALLNLVRYLKKNKIELVQANGKGAGLYGRLVKLFCPQITIVFAYRGFHIFKYNFIQKRMYFLYERLMLTLTDKVINVSIGEQNNCLSNGVLTKEKSIHIYNGISSMSKNEDSKLKELYGNQFIIVTLSRFDVSKNMDSMYKIAYILKDISDFKFIWIGDGEDKERLIQKATEEGLTNIDFVGFKSHIDIQRYFSISKLYLSTSRWEGLPFALIEACSVGLPIVATDVVGNNEVCIDGLNGFVFPSNDEELAAKAIKEIYINEDLREIFGRKSLELFEDRFTVEKMITNHEFLYESLL